jgi:hypothetical protein
MTIDGGVVARVASIGAAGADAVFLPARSRFAAGSSAPLCAATAVVRAARSHRTTRFATFRSAVACSIVAVRAGAASRRDAVVCAARTPCTECRYQNDAERELSRV